MDHAQLVHQQWTQAAELGSSLRGVRVCTNDNIADLPSRDAFEMLRASGATQLEPILHDKYWDPTTWEVLHERWRL